MKDELEISHSDLLPNDIHQVAHALSAVWQSSARISNKLATLPVIEPQSVARSNAPCIMFCTRVALIINPSILTYNFLET